MSYQPKLAIVGRPNVGKSALFNRICKKRIAIVDEAEGITRDRLYAQADCFGRPFEIIDTGGINQFSKEDFQKEIIMQAHIAIEEADTIVMVVDGKVGITELDQQVSRILLKTDKPVCLAVNKMDNLDQFHDIYNFAPLGISEMLAVSASHGHQIAELLEMAFKNVPHKEEENEKAPGIKVSIVGRPNVGKSSLINFLTDENRCIVSPIPGTTRDSVDISFFFDENPYTFIDTAGIRRKHAEKEVVDKFAAIRTEKAIKRSDVCLLMLDAQQGLTAQEKKIAQLIEQEGRSCILLFNKWDLVKGVRMEHGIKNIEDEVPFLAHCPKLFISATSGRNVEKIFQHIQTVYESTNQRVTTHQLNVFVEKVIQKYPPPMITGKRLRIYYMTQIDVHPPRFVLFVNQPNLMVKTYKRYLNNQFRKQFQFTGAPLEMYLKKKKAKLNK